MITNMTMGIDILPVSNPKLLFYYTVYIQYIIYSLVGYPLAPVTMMILHIWRTNSIALAVSRTAVFKDDIHSA